MKIYSLISACILPLALLPFTEVPDTSDLPFLNPDLEMRQTVKIRLNNGLNVLLISDPEADLSSATMAVQCGSWNDPDEYPGMAHFCEHMLFMGSEKYPDENAFMSLLPNFGGSTNAFTADDRTVYMFSSRKEGFLELLDHFAHFYIDPLFNTSSISRELHAVDQEFAKNIQNDGWRIHMIWKETGNPEHPNQMFSIGNSETLSHIPQSALKKWHKEYYGANRMHLAIYSSLPVETLKKNVEEFFNAIPQTEKTIEKTNQPLMSSRQRGHITYITPFQQIQTAILRWELPHDLAEDSTQPAQLLAFALRRAQKKNLEELLKKEQWIDRISISAESNGGNRHRFFSIYLDLTEKGMKEVDHVLLRCFQAIQGVKNEGIPAYLFEERNNLAKLHYQYQSRQDAFSYIRSIGENLLDEPLESFPRAQLLGAEYNPEKIKETVEFLKPQNCAVTLIGSPEQTGILADRKERWFGAEYAIRPISPQTMTLWTTATAHEAIEIAQPNPFVPNQLTAEAGTIEQSAPITIAHNEFGVAYYARCPEFRSPEISHTIHILTPSIGTDAKSQVLTLLYLDHLTDQINPILYAASSAGLNTRFSVDKGQLLIQLSGFSEKAPLLLEEILRNLTLHPPTEEQFQLYYARHEKSFSNAGKELAFRQAKERLDSLISSDKPTSKERLNALRALKYEDFTQFCKTLFDQVYFKALFSGNLSQQQASSCWLDILHALGKKPYLKNLHPKASALHLNPEKGPYRIAETVAVQGNSSLLLIDEGSFSFEKRGAQEILASALKEAFFQELRTKQKTGYIAFSEAQEVEGRLYQYFIVQSNSHQPEDLLYRFELFLEGYLQNFTTEISQERFDTLKESTIDSLKTRFRNLRMKAALWDLLAFEQKGDFAFVEKRIKALQTLTYEEFKTFAYDFLSRENKKRLALLFEGEVAAPFAYQEIKAEEIREVAQYEAKEEDEKI